ncbi:MAG: hypothetical protein JSU97_03990 [Dehalococcoidia bacterium]|nr:MAG: hypothetical protein JSU97_03990 [Dehalococcoidia bacterium]
MGRDQQVKRFSFVVGSLLFLLAASAMVALVLVNGNRGSALEEGSLTVCPGPGKWAISVWTGDDSAAAEDALASCADIRASYWLNPDSQLFLRNFGAERPELNTLLSIDNLQALFVQGGPTAPAAGSTGEPVLASQDEGLVPCPWPSKWALSVWTGDDDTTAEDALASCPDIRAAYWLDPENQLFLRNFGAERSELNTLLTVDNLQGLLVMGGPPPVEATLLSAETTLGLGEAIELTFRLTNRSDDPVTVVKPFVSPNLVFFEVVDASGAPLLFDGPWAKLKPFLADSFVSLEVGESVEQVFDLTQLYEISEAGSYTVTGNYRNWDDGSRFGFSAFITDGLRSNELTIEITE